MVSGYLSGIKLLPGEAIEDLLAIIYIGQLTSKNRSGEISSGLGYEKWLVHGTKGSKQHGSRMVRQ